MSKILLEEAKQFLQIVHDADDATLQQQLDAAEDEALRFMDREYLPVLPLEQLIETQTESDPVSESETPSEVSEEIVPSVRQAVYLLLKVNYEGTDNGVRGALDLKNYRDRAETLLFPFRRHLGV